MICKGASGHGNLAAKHAAETWALLLLQGQMAATFLRHEGFLGAIGAFIGADAA